MLIYVKSPPLLYFKYKNIKVRRGRVHLCEDPPGLHAGKVASYKRYRNYRIYKRYYKFRPCAFS